MKGRQNRGVSTVVGTVLFMILIFTVASTLYLALSRYNDDIQQSISTEQTRSQERIVLVNLTSVSNAGNTYITGIRINNTGTITTHIRAIYVDNIFLCDPSEDKTLNPEDTYINAKESSLINITQIKYVPTSRITAVTGRSIGTAQLEENFFSNTSTVITQPKQNYGPLELNFDKFYYTNSPSGDGRFDPNSWKPGWTVNQTKNGDTFVWNITVKNVDPQQRNIILTQFSALTLIPSSSVSQQNPWYIEPSGQPTGLQNPPKTLTIQYNQNVNIIYTYSTPLGSTPNMKAQTAPSAQNAPQLCKVFLTFFGRFEKDGIISAYGQTIPFEAVLVVQST